MVGQRFGQYQITELIGEGGMAAVYRAHQESMKRDVAIKVIEAKLTKVTEFVKRFEREAQTIASLSHPHILKVFDYGQQGNLVYLVMELLSGGSLSDLIATGPLPLDKASRILEHVSSALDYAHQQGIIHRDLKPPNVLLDKLGNAFLSDFGIAKLLTETSALTQSGTMLGTPTYMAPEIWRGQAADGRADLYALGIVLFEMLSSDVPFKADTTFGLMHMHVYDQSQPIRNLRPDLPTAIDTVINKALAKEPVERFSSAGELSDAFKSAISGQAASAPTVKSEQTVRLSRPTPLQSTADAHPKSPSEAQTVVVESHPAVEPYPATMALPIAQKRRSSAGMIVGGIILIAAIAVFGIVLLGRRDLQPTPAVVMVNTATKSPTVIPASATTAPTDTSGSATALPLLTAVSFGTPTLAAASPAAILTLLPTITATNTPTNAATQPATQVAALPAGAAGKIVYSTSGGIWAMNPDGSNIVQLLNNKDFGIQSAVLSPNGKQIAFLQQFPKEQAGLYTMDADGSNARLLTPSTYPSGHLAWSPDSKRIVFIPPFSESIYNVSFIDSDGKNLTSVQLSGGAYGPVSPAWSPDGKQIVLSVQRSVSQRAIVIMDVESGQVHLLPLPDGYLTDPVWSPDGKQLAYTRASGDILAHDERIYIVNIDGSNQRKLIDIRAQNPTWSPDGKSLAFVQIGDGGYLAAIDVDGSNLHRLTQDSGTYAYPSWAK